MQTSVVLSSMEAEYMAANAATQEALWRARLLQQLSMGIKLLITLYEDNESAIMFADRPGDHRTTTHIDTRTKFSREAQTKLPYQTSVCTNCRTIRRWHDKGLAYWNISIYLFE
jgi:hypothetical protein